MAILAAVALQAIKMITEQARQALRRFRENTGERERLSARLSSQSHLNGIGGWLRAFLIFAILYCVSSFSGVVWMVFQNNVYPSGTLAVFKLVCASVLLLWVWMLTLIASRSRRFLTAATVAVCASVLLEAFRLYLGAVDSLIMIGVFVASLAYFYSSKRVANTYVT